MSNKFIHRIQTERQILNFINSKSCFKSELYGLSGAAVRLWVEKLDVSPSFKNELLADMLEIAEACQSLSDLSDFVFSDDKELKHEKVAKCFDKLRLKYASQPVVMNSFV